MSDSQRITSNSANTGEMAFTTEQEPSRSSGSSPEVEAMLDLPAVQFLAQVPWAGVAPDPDDLAARDFLSWL